MAKVYYHKEISKWVFECPGCGCLHYFDNSWKFNGDREKPTVSPSILVRGTVDITDEEYARIMRGEDFEPKKYICHSFVRDGSIEFLTDSTHHLAGQTVEIPDWEDL